MAVLRCEDLMTRDPSCCASKDSALDALKIMKELNVGLLPICDQDKRLLGVVTDRDIAMSLTNDKKPSECRLGSIMSKDPVTVRPDDEALACARRMEDHQLHRIPVVDEENRILGIIALADIARRAIRRDELESELPSIIEAISSPV